MFFVTASNRSLFGTINENGEWRKKLDDNVVVGTVLTDLSKAFDCIPHDLLIAKLAAYGLSEEALIYILLILPLKSLAMC